MVLLPIHARERDANGLFKSDANLSAEGGYLVKLAANANEINVFNLEAGDDNSGAMASGVLVALFDEQTSVGGRGQETMLGQIANKDGNVKYLGPDTNFASGKSSIFQAKGSYFLTDQFDISITDDEADMDPSTQMNVKLTTDAGLLTDAALSAGVITAAPVFFMGLVNDVNDMLASRVTPLPRNGMDAEGPYILIYLA